MEDVTQIRYNQITDPKSRLGATYVEGQGTYIRLWAPEFQQVQVKWIDGETIDLANEDDGYFFGLFPGIKPGDQYVYIMDGTETPDPASRYQPEGILGPSEIVAQDFAWTDRDWRGIPYEEWVVYEIHTGTYSEKNNFEGIVDDLPRLKELGVTTLEIMPVSQFSGTKNWGYDGVFPHSVQNSYGGPAGLKALVNACHAHGIAIILDVVYNHLGPEGNALYSCGPYTEKKYKTAWGDALNYDGPESDHVRRYFLQTVWQWLTEYHFDGLRLDAIQMIYDNSTIPFLEEVSRLRMKAEEETGRKLILIGETDKNDPKVLGSVDHFGLGFDAHWADDFHHTLHATLTGEQDGYYQIYGGEGQLARIYKRGVAFEGEYSPFHKRRHGRRYDGIDKKRLIVATQNHDQIGNRTFGERLCQLLSPQRRNFAACCMFLSPFTPLLFMGQETGNKTPFLYFTDFIDNKLSEAVREGRAEEWKSFGWKDEPPDPGASETFEKSVLRDKMPSDYSEETHVFDLHKILITYSKKLRNMPLTVDFDENRKIIVLHFADEYLVLLCFHDEEQTYNSDNTVWQEILCSLNFPEERSYPPGAIPVPGFSAVLLQRA